MVDGARRFEPLIGEDIGRAFRLDGDLSPRALFSFCLAIPRDERGLRKLLLLAFRILCAR